MTAASEPGAPEVVPAPAPPARWSEQVPARAAVAYAAAYLVLASGGGELVARLARPWVDVVAVVTVLATTLLSLLLLLAVCRAPIPRSVQVFMFVATTVVFFVARPEVVLALAQAWRLPPRLVMPVLRFSGFPGDTLVGNLALILWAVLVGRLVSRIIREGNLLLPVAVVASLADVITVFWGFVAMASQTAPKVVAALSAQAPAAEVMQTKHLAMPLLTYIGIGDFLFLAIFLTAAWRHRMRAAAAMWAAFLSMLVAAPLVDLSAYGLPGLPFISAGVLLANRKYFHFSREEKRALLLVTGLVVALAGAGVVLLLQRGK